MKIIAAIGAGLLATATFAAAPAEAQGRWGYNDYHRGDGWRGDGWRGDRRDWRGDRRGWRGDRGRRWHGGYRARYRTVCRIERGYYGPVRRCFQVRR
ncbi:hypothetical protein Q5H91_02185 [Sphingomonas sp. KR1UV-12]|uniref:Sulfur globule protein n=1 Tax=Sphingomonas aurea TaxID=3063994 RepID=A0ABT9EGV2_9SPHN|nr:hypothetical protein [Sphingomonas sp. KR1UV-12]MDP1026008.1 hypothetical protein [Sphingomonas sp. KR1UV-12]